MGSVELQFWRVRDQADEGGENFLSDIVASLKCQLKLV